LPTLSRLFGSHCSGPRPSCVRSGSCYRKCTPCCSGVNGSSCRAGSCNNSVCYAADCRSLQRVCTQSQCTINAGCPRRCTKCCQGSSCTYTSCSKCMTPGCRALALPSPPPKPPTPLFSPGPLYPGMYTCSWSCVLKGRCRQWCRKCKLGRAFFTTSHCYGSCTKARSCGAPPPPQKPICGMQCVKQGGCYSMCNCCCLNGHCKIGICTRACFRTSTCK